MPSELFSDVKFDIGHVLFIDIVGYSKLLINDQSERIQKLKENRALFSRKRWVQWAAGLCYLALLTGYTIAFTADLVR